MPGKALQIFPLIFWLYIYHCEMNCNVDIFCYFFDSHGSVELLSEEIEAVKMALPKVGYTLIFNEF